MRYALDVEGDEVKAALRALRFWRSNTRLTGPKREAVRRLYGKLLLVQQATRPKALAPAKRST